MWRGLTSVAVAGALAIASPAAAGAAVGPPTAAGADADAWTVQATTLPAGATSGTLYSVSCTSKNSCTALGSYKAPGHGARPVAEQWNHKAAYCASALSWARLLRRDALDIVAGNPVAAWS